MTRTGWMLPAGHQQVRITDDELEVIRREQAYVGRRWSDQYESSAGTTVVVEVEEGSVLALVRKFQSVDEAIEWADDCGYRPATARELCAYAAAHPEDVSNAEPLLALATRDGPFAPAVRREGRGALLTVARVVGGGSASVRCLLVWVGEDRL
jgi:hypothetical protein